mgnify:CR=1 FL=1
MSKIKKQQAVVTVYTILCSFAFICHYSIWLISGLIPCNNNSNNNNNNWLMTNLMEYAE